MDFEAARKIGSESKVNVTVPAVVAVPARVNPLEVTTYTTSPATMLGSEIVIEIGDVAVAAAPVGVSQVTAKASMADWPVGSSEANVDVFVIGYDVTVVPVGSAPAGTSIVVDAPSEVAVSVVDVLADTFTDVGVPKSLDGSELGGGALVGPFPGVP